MSRRDRCERLRLVPEAAPSPPQAGAEFEFYVEGSEGFNADRWIYSIFCMRGRSNCHGEGE